MMKLLVISGLVIMFLLVTWLGWRLRPLMPAGQTVCLGDWKFKGYEFQIWQRKKSTLSEPFSTSLYVRNHTNAWHQHYLNHQDYYSPSYVLAMTNETVVVYREHMTVGSFDLGAGQYLRVGGGVSLEKVHNGNPP